MATSIAELTVSRFGRVGDPRPGVDIIVIKCSGISRSIKEILSIVFYQNLFEF